jgi:hypothetical protein
LKAESDDVAVSDAALEKATRALAREFPREQVDVYLNTLWLQDPDRWGGLSRATEWLA